MDCKSAYAGSIPTSASTLESPAAIELAGLFLCLRIMPGPVIGTILGHRHCLHVPGTNGKIRYIDTPRLTNDKEGVRLAVNW